MGGSTTAKVPPDPCKCCGNPNHLKRDCRFKDRECNKCGITGHLAAVCWGGNGRGTVDNKARGAKPSPASPNTQATAAATDVTKPPWTCHKCYACIDDQMLQKCPKTDCRTKRLQPEKPPDAPKELIGKEALKIIESRDSTGDDSTADDKKKEEIYNLRDQTTQRSMGGHKYRKSQKNNC